MAAPHISGAISLLWSAIPALRRNIKGTLEILEKTAIHQESTQCRSPMKTPNHGKSNFSDKSLWVWYCRCIESF
jgi:hypothetical protein